MSYRIIPPASDEEASPYWQVWPMIALQVLLMAAVSAVVVLASELFNPQLDGEMNRALTVALTLLPVMLWLAAAVLPEYRVLQPRKHLIGIAMLSALMAAAIGLPLTQDFFRIEQWLPLESSLRRITGFTLTAGMVDTALKLFILRFVVSPKSLRIRSDVIACGLACAVGYSFYLNLALIWDLQPDFGVAAIYVLSNYTIQFASSMFIALGVIESYFGDALPIVLPLNLLLAAVATGVVTALFSGLMNGPLRLAGSSDRPLAGLGFLIIALLFSGAVGYFLYTVSERRQREAWGDADGI